MVSSRSNDGGCTASVRDLIWLSLHSSAQLESATNMTDRLASLSVLTHAPSGERGFARLDELSDDQLGALLSSLEEFEARVSADRHEVHAELDRLTDELVEGYRGRFEGTAAEEPEAES